MTNFRLFKDESVSFKLKVYETFSSCTAHGKDRMQRCTAGFTETACFRGFQGSRATFPPRLSQAPLPIPGDRGWQRSTGQRSRAALFNRAVVCTAASRERHRCCGGSRHLLPCTAWGAGSRSCARGPRRHSDAVRQPRPGPARSAGAHGDGAEPAPAVGGRLRSSEAWKREAGELGRSGPSAGGRRKVFLGELQRAGGRPWWDRPRARSLSSGMPSAGAV